MATTLQANNIFGAPLSQPTVATATPATPAVSQPLQSSILQKTPTVQAAQQTTGTPAVSAAPMAPITGLSKQLNIQPIQPTVTAGTPTLLQPQKTPQAMTSSGTPAVAAAGASGQNQSASTSTAKTTEYAPLGGGSAAEQNAAKKITLDATDPNFEDKAGAIMLQRQREKQVADLQLQQQAGKQQFMQQLTDSGQKGSTLATLTMLKDREYNSALNTLNWNLTQNYLDYLETQHDTYDKDTKAKFSADIAAALESGDVDTARNLAGAIAQLYPDDAYFKAMQNPQYLDTIIKSYDPQVRQRKMDTINNTLEQFKSYGNVMDESLLQTNASSILKNMRNGYSQSELEMMAGSMPDADVEKFAQEFYPDVEFNGSYPESLKEDAWLMKQFKMNLSGVQEQYAAEIAKGLTADLSGGLTDTNVRTINMALTNLIKEGGDVKLDGVTVPADYFTDLDSGASSIFVTDWDGDSDFSNRTATSDAMDQLWLMAVKDSYGDFTMDGRPDSTQLRDQFAEQVMQDAATFGIDLESATPEQLKAMYNKYTKTHIAPAGTYMGLIDAARSGSTDDLRMALSSVDYADPQDRDAVQRLANGLKNTGKLVNLNETKSGWATTPGTYYALVPLGEGNGMGMAVVNVAEPTYNKDTGMWDTHVNVEDPSGAGLLGLQENYDFSLTEDEYGKYGNEFMQSAQSAISKRSGNTGAPEASVTIPIPYLTSGGI